LLHLLGALTLCYGVDDVVIVVDIGSDTVKAGYATDDHPKAKVPAKALCSLVCCLLFVMFGWCVCVRPRSMMTSRIKWVLNGWCHTMSMSMSSR
jgi:hypothetical protein